MTWVIMNEDQKAALDEIYRVRESDRIVAILGGALLDDSLRIALEQRLRLCTGGQDKRDELFAVGRALGNTRPKIDLAYRLYVFEDSVRDTMHGINDVRNIFAHGLNMKFESDAQQMKSAFGQLKLHKQRTHYPHPFYGDAEGDPIEEIQGPKDVFIVNLRLCLIHLMTDSHKHRPWSNIPTGYAFQK